MLRSWACTASIRHEREATPSTSTVQAPQTPCSQPTRTPVAPSSCRRKSHSCMRGSACPWRVRPLSCRRTGKRWSAGARMVLFLNQLPAELAYQVTPVRRAGVYVVLGAERPGESVKCVWQFRTARQAAQHWAVRNAADAELHRVVADACGQRHQGEVAVAHGYFAKAIAHLRIGQRKLHLADQLVRAP